MSLPTKFRPAIAALAIAFLSPPAFAQPTPEPAAPAAPAAAPAGDAPAPATAYGLELNKVEAANEVCTGYFIFRNQTNAALSQAHVQLFVFDAAQQIAGAFTIGFADVRPMGEKVGVYELARPNCDGIGRILVNDVTDCHGPDGAAITTCAADFSATSRATIPLQY